MNIKLKITSVFREKGDEMNLLTNTEEMFQAALEAFEEECANHVPGEPPEIGGEHTRMLNAEHRAADQSKVSSWDRARHRVVR